MPRQCDRFRADDLRQRVFRAEQSAVAADDDGDRNRYAESRRRLLQIALKLSNRRLSDVSRRRYDFPAASQPPGKSQPRQNSGRRRSNKKLTSTTGTNHRIRRAKRASGFAFVRSRTASRARHAPFRRAALRKRNRTFSRRNFDGFSRPTAANNFGDGSQQ